MSLTTYWLIGPKNAFVQVEGAARRDELADKGWTATEEPAAGDQVWTQHETTGAYSPLPYGVLDAWQGRGWQPAVPPTELTDQGWQVVLPDRTEPAEPAPPAGPQPAAAETAAETPPPADKTQQTQKEQKSGR